MKTILVTGAKGFIGSNVLRLLADRDDVVVHATTRIPDEAAPDPVHWHTADLLNPADIAATIERVRPSHLLHLAWDVRPGKFWTSELNLPWVTASIELYRAFVAAGGQRFVGAGSCAEYDWSYNTLKEGVTPYAPSTLYGVSKNGLRQTLESASKLNEVSFAWGHVFFLYGPEESPGRLVSDAIRNCLSGTPMDTTHGHQLRDFMHVRDVARAFVALLASDIWGAVNIATGTTVPLRGVLQMVEQATGTSGLIGFGKRPVSPSEPMCMGADAEKLQSVFDLGSCHSLEDGIEDTVAWWRTFLG